MPVTELRSLAGVFAVVHDFRDPRGRRHPLPALLSLVFLGLLARIREMAVLQRWAEAHWQQLQEPLGFTRPEPPHATTISRALANCSLADFSRAFLAWVRQTLLTSDLPPSIAVDGKTSCQGLDADGQPVQMLTAFVHQLKVVVGQWSVRGEKTNEPTALRRHLPELFENFPLLRLVTGDAIFAQRPLVEALLDENCDYLVQIKANQGDTFDALKNCLGNAHERLPAAQTAEKKGTPSIAAGCGSIWTTSTTFERHWRFPGRKLRCVLFGTYLPTTAACCCRTRAIFSPASSPAGSPPVNFCARFASTGKSKTASSSSKIAGGTKIVTGPDVPASPSGWPNSPPPP